MEKKLPVIIPIILCGGTGSRLWPVSREQHPKPFIRLDDGISLLQKAFLRGATLPDIKDIVTVTNRELFFKTEDEYREIRNLLDNAVNTSFILEPFGRNTAPAIAAASLQIADTYGDNALVLALAADHLISDQQAFASAVARACELAHKGKLVTFGIQPTVPETGYGYIEVKDEEVIRFVEKPTLDKAKDYLDSGNFFWNSGMFCSSAGTVLQEMAEHCPEILEATRRCLQNAKRASGDGLSLIEINPDDFELVPDESIDYAVMEKTRNAAMVTCGFDWSDVGSWQTLGDLTIPDSNNNRIQGDVLIENSKNCTIKSDGRILGVIGVENLIVIDTPDALLVADKNQAQNVKFIYSRLKAQGHETHKLHRTVYRPWGTYTVLEEGACFKIKRIEIKPGASLSLQKHRFRSEHWVVINGTAKGLNEDKEITLNPNESTYIPVGNKHYLENTGSEKLVIIEVQTGEYLGEDDIIRFDDIYGRVL